MGAFIIEYDHSASIGQNWIENNKNKEDFTHVVFEMVFSFGDKNHTGVYAIDIGFRKATAFPMVPQL
jgi:hypothetical protein